MAGENEFKARALSNAFFKEFQENGKYRQILEIVKNDPTMDMFLRGGYVTIYYKCARILEINEKGKFDVERAYYEEEIKPEAQGWSWNAYFQQAKTKINEMDGSFEKEVQQLIVRSNNTAPRVANSTDYFIFDIEYTESGKKSGRFDALAFCWPRKGRNRNDKVKLAFIEVKAGLNALSGACGLNDHLQSTYNWLTNNKDFEKIIAGYKEVIKQLKELGLLNVEKELILSSEKPQYIFILAEYNTNSDILGREVNGNDNCKGMQEFLNENPELPFDLLFATSPFMGYALYEDCMLTWDEFKERIKKYGPGKNKK